MSNKIKNKEYELFNRLSEEWWDENGKFRVLHQIRPIRIQYIINQLEVKNFKKLDILDIGCGGGLVCESLSSLGASVTGVDFIKNNIDIAKKHALNKKLNINYIHNDIEKLNIKKKFDIILNMEIVEHVEDVDYFIKESAKFLKKSGVMFIATLNKTLKSYLFAIVGAEYVLKWLPIGTHDWEKFVKPEELKEILNKNNLSLKKFDGMHFNIIKDEWSITKDLSVNYIAKFLKN